MAHYLCYILGEKAAEDMVDSNIIKENIKLLDDFINGYSVSQ